MKLKKTKVKVETPKVDNAEIELRDKIQYAKNRLANFTERRKAAETPEKVKEYSIWVEHFTKVISDLEKL